MSLSRTALALRITGDGLPAEVVENGSAGSTCSSGSHGTWKIRVSHAYPDVRS